MHRSTSTLLLPLAMGLLLSPLACSSAGSGGGSSAGSSGSSDSSSKAGSSGSSSSGGSSSGGSSSSSKAGSSAGSSSSSKAGSSAGSSGGSSSSSKAGSTGGSTGGSSPGGSTGGSSAGGSTGGSTGTSPNGCGTDDTISNFEEGPSDDDPVIFPAVDIKGKWEMFNDAGGGATQTMKVEASGDSKECSKYALHTAGKGWASYVGIGITNFAGTDKAPEKYPNAKKYTGIKFRAKVGKDHPTKSPVRVNISTPWTEGKDSGGSCAGKTTATTTKSAVDCYQHLGRFLQDDYALTTEYKDITLCFDRDLYPLSLPTTLTNEQRESVASNMLKVQFQFNQAKDWTVSNYPAEGKYEDINKTTAFDLWIDDISFFSGECPVKDTFKGNGDPKLPFPQNKAPSGGSCGIAKNADKFNTAISQIYARWTKNFVRDGKVICPEQENGVTTSESMGYGMMITAAMGDKAAFDKMWGYVKGQLSGGLMTWKPGSQGSATDGDEDIVWGLYMADAQWGGYKSDADAMGKAMKADFAGDVVSGGSQYTSVFNPSYFAPAVYRKIGGYDSVITKTYDLVSKNVNASTAGFATDWGDMSSGSPKTAAEVGAQVFSGLDGKVLGYDAARVPWRLGLDVCTGGSQGKAILETMTKFFGSKYDSGNSINFMKAGWVKDSGEPHSKSVDCQGSFIGPMGVAGMAVGGSDGEKFRDTAFRAMLDILDYGDFNHTYFPSTVGFLTVLLMSGNFPTP